MPCDFDIHVSLKEVLEGNIFMSDDNVQEAVAWMFMQQHKEFSADGIHCLGYQWDSCLNAHSDFFFVLLLNCLHR